MRLYIYTINLNPNANMEIIKNRNKLEETTFPNMSEQNENCFFFFFLDEIIQYKHHSERDSKLDANIQIKIKLYSEYHHSVKP